MYCIVYVCVCVCVCVCVPSVGSSLGWWSVICRSLSLSLSVCLSVCLSISDINWCRVYSVWTEREVFSMCVWQAAALVRYAWLSSVHHVSTRRPLQVSFCRHSNRPVGATAPKYASCMRTNAIKNAPVLYCTRLPVVPCRPVLKELAARALP